jgi:hypothetical protein
VGWWFKIVVVFFVYLWFVVCWGSSGLGGWILDWLRVKLVIVCLVLKFGLVVVMLIKG